MQYNEEYVLGVLHDGGLLTRNQIDSARSRPNGEPGVLDVLINDGALSEADVSRTLAAQAHMDWIGTADEAERFNAIPRSRSAQVMHRNRQIRDSATR